MTPEDEEFEAIMKRQLAEQEHDPIVGTKTWFNEEGKIVQQELKRSEVYKDEREWVGLTDDEIKEIVGPWGDTPIKGYTRYLFDKIEAKLKEKNT